MLISPNCNYCEGGTAASGEFDSRREHVEEVRFGLLFLAFRIC